MQKYWQDYQQQFALFITAIILLIDVILFRLGIDFALKMLPVILAIIASICLMFWGTRVNKKLLCFVAVLIVSYLFEVFILKIVFASGELKFGSIMGYKLLGVPFTIGLIGFLAIIGSLNIVSFGNLKRTSKYLLAGLIIFMFFTVLEQFAGSFGVWVWRSTQMPVANYLLWITFSVAIIFTIDKYIKFMEPNIYIAVMLPMLSVYFWLLASIS